MRDEQVPLAAGAEGAWREGEGEEERGAEEEERSMVVRGLDIVERLVGGALWVEGGGATARHAYGKVCSPVGNPCGAKGSHPHA